MIKPLPALGICSVWFIAWWTLYPRLGPRIKAWGLSRLGSTADYFFTYLGPELLIFVFGLVVMPLLYFFVLRRFACWLQILLAPALLAGCVFGAYYDVLQIAREAERLCTTEAGMHVYRTVEAEGILGVSDIRYWAAYGFSWVEYVKSPDKYVALSLTSGDIVQEVGNRPKSEFEYRLHSHSPISRNLEKSVASIVDSRNGAILGKVVYFHIFWGWADRVLDSGFKFKPPVCWRGKPAVRGGLQIFLPTNLIESVVSPLSRN